MIYDSEQENNACIYVKCWFNYCRKKQKWVDAFRINLDFWLYNHLAPIAAAVMV